MRKRILYILDMLESMQRISEYIYGESGETFVKHRMLVDAVIRNLEVIGEAAGKVSDEFRERYPEVP